MLLFTRCVCFSRHRANRFGSNRPEASPQTTRVPPNIERLPCGLTSSLHCRHNVNDNIPTPLRPLHLHNQFPHNLPHQLPSPHHPPRQPLRPPRLLQPQSHRTRLPNPPLPHLRLTPQKPSRRRRIQRRRLHQIRPRDLQPRRRPPRRKRSDQRDQRIGRRTKSVGL